MATLPRELLPCNGGPMTVRAQIDPDYDPTADTVELQAADALVEPIDRRLFDILAPRGPDPSDTYIHLPLPDAAPTVAVSDNLLLPFDLSTTQAVPPPTPAHPTVTPLQRDWFELKHTVATAARLVEEHLSGWVATAEREADLNDDAWPHDVPQALTAAWWVLLNIGGSLNAEVYPYWKNALHHHVWPLLPLVDADAETVPHGRDALADLVAILDDVADDIGRCVEQQERLSEFDPANGSLLDTLGGGRLALERVITTVRDDLRHEVEVAATRRNLARLRQARNLRMIAGQSL